MYQPQPVQYNTTYPLKPGSACELIYTSYIGLYAVSDQVVNFGHFFIWGGVPSCPNCLLSVFVSSGSSGGEMGEEHTPYSDQCMQTSIFDQQFFCLTHLAWVGVKLPGIKYKFCQNMDFFHLYYIKRRQLTKTL